MLRLALAAVALLVVMPSAGRLAGTGPMASAGHAMHAGGGHGTHGGPGAPTAPAPLQPAATTHYDCAYCPLLASMLPSAPACGVLPTGPCHARVRVHAAEPRLPWRHPWGLGSRGPPMA
ncbi:DUF2946 family protein [Novilysobacter defluvii]